MRARVSLPTWCNCRASTRSVVEPHNVVGDLQIRPPHFGLRGLYRALSLLPVAFPHAAVKQQPGQIPGRHEVLRIHQLDVLLGEREHLSRGGDALSRKINRHLDGRRGESRPESVGRNRDRGGAARNVEGLRGDIHRSGREYEVGRLVEAKPSGLGVHLRPVARQGLAVLGFRHRQGKSGRGTVAVLLHGRSQAVLERKDPGSNGDGWWRCLDAGAQR